MSIALAPWRAEAVKRVARSSGRVGSGSIGPPGWMIYGGAGIVLAGVMGIGAGIGKVSAGTTRAIVIGAVGLPVGIGVAVLAYLLVDEYILKAPPVPDAPPTADEKAAADAADAAYKDAKAKAGT